MSSSSSTIFTSLFLLGLIGVILTDNTTKRERLPDLECSSNGDCQDDHCCVISPSRYSLPQCLPKREKGNLCRPNNEKINTTVTYPFEEEVTLTNVFYVICPCKDGLTCDRKDGVCM